MYQQQPCDLVITDIFMPDKDGIELIVKLKRLEPEVKILAISEQGFRVLDSGRPLGETYLEVARELGANDILERPIRLERIITTVVDLLIATGFGRMTTAEQYERRMA